MRRTVTLLLLWLILLSGCHKEVPYRSAEGLIFGTLYRITYQADEDLSDQINEALQEVNRVANPFDSTSMLYAVNNNLSMTVDSTFYVIYSVARRVYEQSGGAYDVTIAPLVNAWGFGFEEGYSLTQVQVDSLLELVGMDKVSCTPTELTKANPAMELDFASVAKGYASDLVGARLRRAGVTNYLVEIGGEIAYSGRNPRGAPWRIGISKPDLDSLGLSQELQEVIDLPGERGGVATSGNYRNFKVTPEGRLYGHTISALSGYPAETDIMSATVLAPTCAEADALATAFMASGYEGSEAMRKQLSSDVSYLLFVSAGDSLAFTSISSPSFPQSH